MNWKGTLNTTEELSTEWRDIQGQNKYENPCKDTFTQKHERDVGIQMYGLVSIVFNRGGGTREIPAKGCDFNFK